jgi:Flp pilus assembly protein TadG
VVDHVTCSWNPSISDRSSRVCYRGPLLAMLMLGTWELGRMIQAAQVLSNAAREGGRQAAAGLKTRAEVRQFVVNYLQRAGIKCLFGKKSL